jgi:nucleotide-binding universal stress UspA family protein
MRISNPRTILFPTDHSKASQAALYYALALAQSNHARLVILHVVGTLGPEQVTYGEAVSQRQPDGYRQRLWEGFRRQLRFDLGDAELVLREGDPVKAIVLTAAEKNCGLIVMGKNERSGLERLLFRGTTEKVLGLAPCPVLVVPTSPTRGGYHLDNSTALVPRDALTRSAS